MCMYRCFLYVWNLLNNFRDGFYEILRLWERQHMTPGWSVSEALGDRIRALVSAKTELSNHLHFARLFQSQLIAVRIGPPLEKNIICLPSSKKKKKNSHIFGKNIFSQVLFQQSIRKRQSNYILISVQIESKFFAHTFSVSYVLFYFDRCVKVIAVWWLKLEMKTLPYWIN